MALLWFASKVRRSLPLTLPEVYYSFGHRAVQLNGCEGAPLGPGFVITTGPGSLSQTLFTSLSPVMVPGTTSSVLIFFGAPPEIVAVAPALILFPVTSRKNWPVAFLSRVQPVMTAMSDPGPPPPGGVVAALQVKVTWMPCSLPVVGHGAPG